MIFPHYFSATAKYADFGPPIAVEHPCGVTMHQHARFSPLGAGGIDPEGRVWLYCRDYTQPWAPRHCWVRLEENAVGNDHLVKT